MQMTAVYSCVRILAEAVAGLPLHLYRYKEDGGKEKALDHPLYNLLHDEPNPEMSSFVFRETLMTHLLLWGQRLRPDHPQRQGRGHCSLSADAKPHGGGQGHQRSALLPVHHPSHQGRGMLAPSPNAKWAELGPGYPEPSNRPPGLVRPPGQSMLAPGTIPRGSFWGLLGDWAVGGLGLSMPLPHSVGPKKRHRYGDCLRGVRG